MLLTCQLWLQLIVIKSLGHLQSFAMKPLWCPLSQTCLNCLLYPRLNTKVEQILSFDMLGLVPRTEFLKWPRENHHHKKITKDSDTEIQSDLKSKRFWILHHFFTPPQPSTTNEAQLGSITRSDIEIIGDWVTYSDTYGMKATTECYISYCPMEQLYVTENKTKLLLLVNVNDYRLLFNGKGSKIDKM